MRRALFVVALLLAAVALFGQGKDPAGVDPTGASISFWYQFSGASGEAMQKMIADFNATNAQKIAVSGTYQGNYDQVYNKMLAAIAAKNPPDLVVAYQNQAATYAVNDALVDMNVYVKDPLWGIAREISDFFPGFINQDLNAQFGGKRLGFPPNRSLDVMYVNLSMLKSVGIAAPPKTWEEFAADCQRVTNKDKGTYGYAVDNLDASNVFAFLISRGGDFARSDGKGYTFNTPSMKSTLLFMAGLVKQGYARLIAKKYDDQNDFGNGLVAFTTSSTSGYPYFEAAVKANKNGAFDWTIAPVPQAAATNAPAVDLYGASVSIPRSTPARQLAAWLFIKWFSQPKQQALWTHVTHYFPVRRGVEPLIKDLLDSDKTFATAWALLKNATLKTEPPYAGYDLVRDAVVAAYTSVLNGGDPDAALSTLQTKADKIFQDAAP